LDYWTYNHKKILDRDKVDMHECC